MITLNPVAILTISYLLVNLLSTILGCLSGEIQVENSIFRVESSSLIYSFLLQTLCLISFYIIYRHFYNGSFRIQLVLKRKWGVCLLISQISFIIFNLTMGVNTAGTVDRVESGSFVNYLFILLQPDILFSIVSVCLQSGFLFFANILVYLCSMFLRGWMGGTFIILFLILSRYQNIKISGKTLLYSIFSLLLFFTILPLIIEAKWAMRTGIPLVTFLADIPSYFSLDNYFSGLNYLLNRFQHVGHLAIIFQNADELYVKYHKGFFSSFYMDGLPQYFIAKIFDLSTYKASFYLVEYFFGVSEPSWNINTGLVGWFFMLKYEAVLLVLYVIFLLIVPYYILQKYSGGKMISVLACFSIVYLFHGWFGAYVNLALYACVISMLANVKLHGTVKL